MFDQLLNLSPSLLCLNYYSQNVRTLCVYVFIRCDDCDCLLRDTNLLTAVLWTCQAIFCTSGILDGFQINVLSWMANLSVCVSVPDFFLTSISLRHKTTVSWFIKTHFLGLFGHNNPHPDPDVSSIRPAKTRCYRGLSLSGSVSVDILQSAVEQCHVHWDIFRLIIVFLCHLLTITEIFRMTSLVIKKTGNTKVCFVVIH